MAESGISKNVAISLSGGGARGAYQVGVLRGISEIAKSRQIDVPYKVLTGVSTGAINAAFLASHPGDCGEGIEELARFWGNLRTQDVFRIDAPSFAKIGLRLILDAVSGGHLPGKRAQAILDTSPLHALLRKLIGSGAIEANLKAGKIDSVAVSATDYGNGECTAFYMSNQRIEPWFRSRRRGVNGAIEAEHVLASAAIPMLFPPVTVRGRQFGDGCLRNSAPLSPALHLGAEKLLIIGVRKSSIFQPELLQGESGSAETKPVEQLHRDVRVSIGRVLNVVINAVLLDSVDADLERMVRINRTVELLSPEALRDSGLRHVDWLYFHPSEDIAAIAMQEIASLPRLLRWMVRGLGRLEEAADVISYLFFEPVFTRRLMDLGYRDAMTRATELRAFFSSNQV